MSFLFLCPALLAAALGASAADAPSLRLDPPPGWSDASGRARPPGVLVALQGPASSSFVVARAPGPGLHEAVAVRAFLDSALEGLRQGSHLDYRVHGKVQDLSLRNGLNAHLLRADLDGRPRLVIAVFQVGGQPFLATLSSSAPDAMLGPLLGAIALENATIRSSGTAHSRDGQLQIALGGGLSARRLSGPEIEKGAVLAVLASGSEAVFFRREGLEAEPSRQFEGVRQAVAGRLGVPLRKVSVAKLAQTPAGPSAVYAWAEDPSGRLAVGFLPWGYWGYSIVVRGSQVDETLIGVLAAIRLGPAAAERLVAASPRFQAPAQTWKLWLLAGIFAGLGLMAAYLLGK